MELKPLRVYSEQAEASEFPVPRVGSRKLLRKSPREGRPNQSLRCARCLWGLGGVGLSCPDSPV